jgi:hypothetical protein
MGNAQRICLHCILEKTFYRDPFRAFYNPVVRKVWVIHKPDMHCDGYGIEFFQQVK